MDDALSAMVSRALARVHPGLLEEMQEEMGAIMRDAQRRWPVGDYSRKRPPRGQVGHSRDQFQLVTTVQGDELKVSIRNTAHWWVHVRPVDLFAGTALNEWVRRPVRAASRRMLKALAKRAKKGITGG